MAKQGKEPVLLQIVGVKRLPTSRQFLSQKVLSFLFYYFTDDVECIFKLKALAKEDRIS